MRALHRASEKGQVMVEYLIVVVFVGLVLAIAFVLLGKAIRESYFFYAVLWSLPFP